MSLRHFQPKRRVIALVPAEQLIPPGPYCYQPGTIRGRVEQPEGNGSLTDCCPFWALRENPSGEDFGWCGYMRRGDADAEGLSLLFDQVKECGVKLEEELVA